MQHGSCTKIIILWIVILEVPDAVHLVLAPPTSLSRDVYLHLASQTHPPHQRLGAVPLGPTPWTTWRYLAGPALSALSRCLPTPTPSSSRICQPGLTSSTSYLALFSRPFPMALPYQRSGPVLLAQLPQLPEAVKPWSSGLWRCLLGPIPLGAKPLIGKWYHWAVSTGGSGSSIKGPCTWLEDFEFKSHNFLKVQQGP